MDFEQYITRDARICGGQPVVKGTRVPIRTILATLAEGATDEDVLRQFPTVSHDALRAVIAFAASSAEEDLPVPPVPTIA